MIDILKIATLAAALGLVGAPAAFAGKTTVPNTIEPVGLDAAQIALFNQFAAGPAPIVSGAVDGNTFIVTYPDGSTYSFSSAYIARLIAFYAF